MSKVSKILLIIFLLSFGSFVYFPQIILGGNNPCAQTTVSVQDVNYNFNTIFTIDTKIDMNRQGRSNKDVAVIVEGIEGKIWSSTNSEGVATFDLGRLIPGGHRFDFWIQNGATNRVCGGTFNVPDAGQGGGTTPGRGDTEISPYPPPANQILNVTVKKLSPGKSYYASIVDTTWSRPDDYRENLCWPSTSEESTFQIGPFSEGSYTIIIMENKNSVSSSLRNDSQCIGVKSVIASTTITFSTPTASSPPDPCESNTCSLGGGAICNDARGPAIKTAVGCIHTNPAALVKDLMTWVLGISGGLAFLMMLLGAFQMLTSAGNPDTLRAGRERLTSAVIGLLFVIFAILLLQIIGVGILNIPGFK